MPATRSEPKPDPAALVSDRIRGELARRVLLALGSPPALLGVQAHHLWGQHFRVNVLVGEHAACASVADSFFIEAGGDGSVLRSFPPLMRRY